jgi:hypothetical protein
MNCSLLLSPLFDECVDDRLLVVVLRAVQTQEKHRYEWPARTRGAGPLSPLPPPRPLYELSLIFTVHLSIFPTIYSYLSFSRMQKAHCYKMKWKKLSPHK